MSATAVCS